ncbi:MAG: hypothetical protein KTR35_19290 [Gammaproteobacteria bacterium]|nr:hypothetical protein [Gammaproteobacteria bacterium]
MRIRRLTQLGLGLVLGLMLFGCASLEPAQQDPPQEVLSKSMPDGSIRYDTEDPRLAQLWAAAEQARIEQKPAQALEHIYDALEISPTNSLLWSRAAELQLEGDEALQAENFAFKSNLYAGNNSALLLRNWMIIEHARSLRGDLLGVRSAHKKVQQYQYN